MFIILTASVCLFSSLIFGVGRLHLQPALCLYFMALGSVQWRCDQSRWQVTHRGHCPVGTARDFLVCSLKETYKYAIELHNVHNRG